MHFLKIILFCTVTSLLLNCKSEKEKPLPEKSIIKDSAIAKPKPQKKLVKKVEKSWDTLNYNNVKTFFTEYGKLNKETKVVIKTKFGNIKLKLFNETPIHRANFIFLAKTGYFNTTVFHRVNKEMVIQGGEAEGEESARIRNKYKNYRLPAEILKHRKHKYGALALAKNEDYNPENESNPFNFYIVNNGYGAHHLDGLYTVFGQVISGYSTVKKISNVKTGISEWPIDDIHITMEVID